MTKKLAPTLLLGIILLSFLSFLSMAQHSVQAINTSSLVYNLQTLINDFASITTWDDYQKAYTLGIKTKAELQDWYDNLPTSTNYDAYVIVVTTVLWEKFNITLNEAKTRFALDTWTILANGLPAYFVNPGFANYSIVTARYPIRFFHWAEVYNYRLDKWNRTKAFENFDWAVSHSTYGYGGVYQVFSDNTTSTGSGTPRFYDESAETLDTYLEFYSLNITEALNKAQLVWQYINKNDWTGTGTNAHYQYKPNSNMWETEASAFEQIALKLLYYAPTTPDVTRTQIDMQNRYLVSTWLSPQWSISGTKYYAVVHANPSNSQRRLIGTLNAWSSIFGTYLNLTDSYKSLVQNLLEGNSTYNPSWILHESSTASLYRALPEPRWRYYSDALYNAQASSLAPCLLLLLGMIPQTSTLAIPLEEYAYEYTWNIVDGDLFRINITSRQVRLSLARLGTIKFIFNQTFTENFEQQGTYDLTFDSNWNSITTKTYVGALPTNRIYQFYVGSQCDVAVTGIVPSKTLAGRGYSVSIDVTVQNQGVQSETFDVKAYYGSNVIGTRTVNDLQSKDSTTLIFTWDTTGVALGNYDISAYATPVADETDTADNTLNGGTISVVVPGDVNADGANDIADAGLLSAHWYPGPPMGPLGYDANADINSDGVVDLVDFSIVSAYWTGPPKGPLVP